MHEVPGGDREKSAGDRHEREAANAVSSAVKRRPREAAWARVVGHRLGVPVSGSLAGGGTVPVARRRRPAARGRTVRGIRALGPPALTRRRRGRCRGGLFAAAISAGSAEAGSSAGGGGTVAIHSLEPGLLVQQIQHVDLGVLELGLQCRASNGQTSMQMPQYMHREKSMANRSSTLRWRSRPPSVVAGSVSLWESM